MSTVRLGVPPPASRRAVPSTLRVESDNTARTSKSCVAEPHGATSEHDRAAAVGMHTPYDLGRISSPDDTRLAMLQTVRARTAGLFEDSAARHAAELRHRHLFVVLAETVILKGDGQSEGLATIDVELDNLRLAMDRAGRDG